MNKIFTISIILHFILFSTYNNNHCFIIGERDRDVVILRHDIGILWPNGNREKRGITLVEYGQVNGQTAMARTVALPSAITAKMVLDGKY